MLYGILAAVHLLVSIILILVVLLQTGKGADLAGAFGGGDSQTAFGSRGAATVLSKLTTTAAVLFMLTSFSLAIISSRDTASVLDETDAAPIPVTTTTADPVPAEASPSTTAPDNLPATPLPEIELPADTAPVEESTAPAASDSE
ncbi:MAG: preprotein translocase subunit SecG [Acidobacteria bacterium]|nr:preprotein translocase subunit SecG [Acidobacteriota bacterium]